MPYCASAKLSVHKRFRDDPQPLLLGAAVRLRGRGDTGLIIGNTPGIDHVSG